MNVSSNGIDNLDFIENLKELRTFKCEDNKIEKVYIYIYIIWYKLYNNYFKFSDLKKLKNCIRLSEIIFLGNPISKMNKYRDNVILNVENIKILDQREIKAKFANMTSLITHMSHIIWVISYESYAKLL